MVIDPRLKNSLDTLFLGFFQNFHTEYKLHLKSFIQLVLLDSKRNCFECQDQVWRREYSKYWSTLKHSMSFYGSSICNANSNVLACSCKMKVGQYEKEKRLNR